MSGIKDLVAPNLNQTLPTPSQPPREGTATAKYKQHESFDLSSTGGSIEKKSKAGPAKRPPVDPNRTRNQIVMETSRAEQQAGVNVSYDNSFTAIKRDIQHTVDKNAKAKEAPLGPIAEVPGPKKGIRMTGNFGISPRVPKKEDDRKDKLNQS